MHRRRTVSEKTAEAAADEWQIIAADFVGQEYRGMQSLCAGDTEGCGSPVEISVRSTEAPTESAGENAAPCRG